jgi:hypothetical protein
MSSNMVISNRALYKRHLAKKYYCSVRLAYIKKVRHWPSLWFFTVFSWQRLADESDVAF